MLINVYNIYKYIWQLNGDEDMPPISVMIKPASGLCNMKCDYCFYSDEAKKRTCETYGYMTEQTLKML